jgi:hypothetical protein
VRQDLGQQAKLLGLMCRWDLNECPIFPLSLRWDYGRFLRDVMIY